jgi:hypothetical protein
VPINPEKKMKMVLSMDAKDWIVLDLEDEATWPDKGALCLRYYSGFSFLRFTESRELVWDSSDDAPEPAKTGDRYLVLKIRWRPRDVITRRRK